MFGFQLASPPATRVSGRLLPVGAALRGRSLAVWAAEQVESGLSELPPARAVQGGATPPPPGSQRDTQLIRLLAGCLRSVVSHRICHGSTAPALMIAS